MQHDSLLCPGNLARIWNYENLVLTSTDEIHGYWPPQLEEEMNKTTE